jgi:hypothetical protein
MKNVLCGKTVPFREERFFSNGTYLNPQARRPRSAGASPLTQAGALCPGACFGGIRKRFLQNTARRIKKHMSVIIMCKWRSQYNQRQDTPVFKGTADLGNRAYLTDVYRYYAETPYRTER